MSIFGTILSKFGLGDGEAAAEAAPVAAEAAAADASTAEAPTEAAAAVVAAISAGDVVAHLEALSAAHDEDLNWQVSIVDLMKLLSMDSSLTARKALATELACPEETMAESADMNVWLHKAVLTKLAENGGNVPASLLD